jgi:hypothetical protein
VAACARLEHGTWRIDWRAPLHVIAIAQKCVICAWTLKITMAEPLILGARRALARLTHVIDHFA